MTNQLLAELDMYKINHEHLNNLLEEKDKEIEKIKKLRNEDNEKTAKIIIEMTTEIERLNKEKDDLDDYNRHLYNENKKLNNIIYGLEKDLEEVFNKMKEKQVGIGGRGYYYTDLIPIEDILDKLKKLKEGK